MTAYAAGMSIDDSAATDARARLDKLGWDPATYRLLGRTDREALIQYDTVFEPYVILDLGDGRQVAAFKHRGDALAAFAGRA